MKYLDKATILGTDYDVFEGNSIEDPLLRKHDAYVDSTLKVIILSNLKDREVEVEELAEYKERLLRHEIIHAFLIESGLDDHCDWQNEEMVDWLALQAEKLFEAFKSTDCI